MIDIALSLLFSSAGLFAIASIAVTLYRYGPAVRALRQAACDLPRERNVRLVISQIRVRTEPQAEIFRPDFAAPVRIPAYPLQAPLRAAA